MKNILIVGGSSGLGLELARILNCNKNYSIAITGRRDPHEHEEIKFISLDLGHAEHLPRQLTQLVEDYAPNTDILIYAAGFFQEGTISDLSDEDIMAMESVGVLAPAMLLQRLLKKRAALEGFIAITSTSQWTPRLLEPVYTAAKAGLGMMAHSISLDERIGKVLVAAPSGMRTRFWEKSTRNMNAMLDPAWVAKQILDHYEETFDYRFIRILRDEPRVEIVETR